MPAKIKHIAIVSDQYALEGRFYEAVFGMRTAADKRPDRAVTVSDGYVGVNINPRKAGRPAGLDHFGVEVEDAERLCAQLCERYPAIEVLKRPGTRPFAGISAHDPAGNLFDLSQENMENRTSVYVEPSREQARWISHLALRTLQAVGDNNPHLRAFPVGAGPEGRARLALFERCPYGAHHLADPDGVLLDIAEK